MWMLAIIPNSAEIDPMKAGSNNRETICPLKEKKKLLKAPHAVKVDINFLYICFSP